MAPSDATDKNRNIDAQLQSILYTTAEKKDLGKFTFCRTFGAQKLVHSEPLLDYPYELQHLLSAVGSDVPVLNNCGGIFFKSPSYLYELVR